MNTSEHSNITALEFLAETELHKGHWNTNGKEANPVGNEEQSSTPLEAQVGETPEVSKADTVANHSQDECGSAQPAGPLGVFSFVWEEPRGDVFWMNTEECRPSARLILHLFILSYWLYWE